VRVVSCDVIVWLFTTSDCSQLERLRAGTSTVHKSCDLNFEEELRWVFVVLPGGSRAAEIWGRLLPRFRAAYDVTQRAAPKTP